ncbi:MAG: hypothetical protein V1747_03250, partial [Candidatus Omnitrophota bacterium]
MNKKIIKIILIVFAVLTITARANCFSANDTVMNQEDIKEKLVGSKAVFTDDGFFYVYDDNG